MLQRGQVGHGRHLLPGDGGPVDAVPGGDGHIAGADTGAGGDQHVGVGVVSVPDCLGHVCILPILAIGRGDGVSYTQ